MPEIILTQQDLVADLHQAGIATGDVVIVHSSFKAIGPVQGGADTVVAALIAVVGHSGTILMPTFAYPQPDGFFHVATTPSRTGAITEAFRTSPGTLRSYHPTHAVSALGARASEFIAGHEQTSGLGVGSPFHKAAVAGAKVLMIGCDLCACSLIHVAEAMQRVPYLGRVWFEGRNRALTLVTPEGKSIRFPPRDLPCCSTGFLAVQSTLHNTGRLRRVTIGRADALLFNGAAALDAANALLETDASALLCSVPECPVCPKARKILAGDVQ